MILDLNTRLLLLQVVLAKAKLIQIAKNELTMLQDMVGVDVVDRVVNSVNMRVAVLKRRLENKRSRESVTCGGTVVGAGIATLTLDVGNVGVLRLR
jgi:hypothetical protein